MRCAIDWDLTLVDEHQQWLPGALEFLWRTKRRGHEITIHTCRANWPEGLAGVRKMLDEAQLNDVPIWTDRGKPDADVYIDDRAVRFSGDWEAPLAHADASKLAHRAPRMASSVKTKKPRRPKPAPGWR